MPGAIRPCLCVQSTYFEVVLPARNADLEIAKCYCTVSVKQVKLCIPNRKQNCKFLGAEVGAGSVRTRWPKVFAIPPPRGRHGPASAWEKKRKTKNKATVYPPMRKGQKGSLIITTYLVVHMTAASSKLVQSKTKTKMASSCHPGLGPMSGTRVVDGKRARKSTSPRFRKYRQGAETTKSQGNLAVLIYQRLDM